MISSTVASRNEMCETRASAGWLLVVTGCPNWVAVGHRSDEEEN